MLSTLTGSLVGLMILGMPIAFAMIVSSLAAILYQGNLPVTALPQRLVVGLDSFPLLAIPFFVLAGNLMHGGGITRRLIRLSNALVGHIRGSLAHVTIMTNIFMSGVSGSAVADAAATGSAMIPAMEEQGYGRGFAAAITGAAANIGPIIPPSIPMVIYGSIAGVSIGQLFLGGVIPGLLFGSFLALFTYFIAKKRGYGAQQRATAREMLIAVKDAAFALVMPAIIVVGILSGAFTPTESAVVAAVYAFVVGMFIYKELKWADLPLRLRETVTTTAVVALIIGASAPFGWILAWEQGPQKVLALFEGLMDRPWMVLLILNILLLLLGCFLEGIAIIIITTPVIMPLLAAMGIDPVLFGVVLTLNIMMGTITPPVGVVMYVVCGISRCTIPQFVREVWPFMIALTAVIFLATYIPNMVLWLPRLLMP